MNTNIFVAEGKLNPSSSLWEPAQGSSLKEEHHQLISDGKAIVKSSGSKVKIFSKVGGSLKSIRFEGGSIEGRVKQVLGQEAIIHGL
ncbi:MAG: hypothetical protein WC108_07990 [Bacteroidales bacterium]|jgi:hypothetical protein|nr:hypothetical protein [Candidatus Absconditabacteria bacterium]